MSHNDRLSNNDLFDDDESAVDYSNSLYILSYNLIRYMIILIFVIMLLM